MKRATQVCLAFCFCIPIFTTCQSHRSSGRDDVTNDTNDSISAQNITHSVKEDDFFFDEEGEKVSEKSEYRGNLIATHDSIKVYLDFLFFEDDSRYSDDVLSKEESYLIRYVNETPKDSMAIIGPYNRLIGKDNYIKVAIGTDTLNVDISTPFKKSLDARYVGILPGCRFYRFSKHFKLSEKSFSTDFQINLAIRDDDPDYIKEFINKRINDNVAGYFADYSGDKAVYPKIPLYDIEDGDFSKLSRYYYSQFCRLYKEAFTENVVPAVSQLGPHYSYQFYAYPVWEDAEHALVTWKFYTYGYMGGAHGGEQEFYLTFDNDKGRILGIDDFYSRSKFKKATDVVTRQLNTFHGKSAYEDYSFSAEIDEDSSTTLSQSNLLNEKVDGKIYPRPALIRQGIVFTYQTYEKGSNGDGVLHFIQPYKYELSMKF